MEKAKKTGKQQKKLLQKKKGNDMELESGKSKAQLPKEGANKAQIEVPNRTVNLLGKRCSPPENTRSHVSSKKAQKQEHKNPEEAIDSRNQFEDTSAPKRIQPKRSHKPGKKKEEGIEDPVEDYTYEHQATQTHLITW